MSKKSVKKHQKLYRMKGCSKKTRKNRLGGMNLAYTGKNISTISNPFLAYTGKGGSCNNNLSPAVVMPINTNSADKSLPNTGPNIISNPAALFLNSQKAGSGGGIPLMRGGCGCGMPLMSGGGCGCGMPFMNGGGLMIGGQKHRHGCKCSSCKKMQNGGNPGIAYPNGLVGSPWSASNSDWPGVNGIQGDRNFIAPNNYKTDVQTSIIPSRGGRRKHNKKQKGGALDNFMGQDLINLGRQFQFGLGSAYNALAGYSSPINPLPWKGQLINTPSLTTIKAANL